MKKASPASATPRQAAHRKTGRPPPVIAEARRLEISIDAMTGLDDPDVDVRRDVIANLEAYSGEVIRKALRDADPTVREEAIRRLPFLECGRDVADCLLAAARDADSSVCDAALDVVGEMEEAVQQEFYSSTVWNGNADARKRAVDHMIELDALSPYAVNIVQAGLTDDSEEVRQKAMEVINFHYDKDFESPIEAYDWLKVQAAAGSSPGIK